MDRLDSIAITYMEDINSFTKNILMIMTVVSYPLYTSRLLPANMFLIHKESGLFH